MKTSEFRTRTIFNKRNNPSFNPNTWAIALDIGYSAVKGMSENMQFCFPSYAKQVSGNILSLGEPDVNEIYYRDNIDGNIWAVGSNAQEMVTLEDSNDSSTSLYGRNRYFSDIFKIVSRTGIALGLLDNEFGNPAGKELFLQTGLPPAYLESDAPLLKEALCGNHSFELKIGTNPWVKFEYNLPENNIFIMEQPMGTLISISTANNGMYIKEAEKYFKSRVLIFDPGFGTGDCFLIKNKAVVDSQTFSNLGMRQVMQDTCDAIYKKYNVRIPVPAIQPYLKNGTVMNFDRHMMKSIPVHFDNILEECNKNVCSNAIEKLKELYNYLLEVDYLVITGGTGAAWSNYIREHFKLMENLQIISGNQNDTLPYIFSNVRGYYMFLVKKIRKV